MNSMDEVFTETKLDKIRSRVNFWWYWNVKRRLRNFGIHLIWLLPKRVIYWAVCRAAVTVEPNNNPENVTAAEMLQKFNYN